jgi:hypothetical protein
MICVFGHARISKIPIPVLKYDSVCKSHSECSVCVCVCVCMRVCVIVSDRKSVRTCMFVLENLRMDEVERLCTQVCVECVC